MMKVWRGKVNLPEATGQVRGKGRSQVRFRRLSFPVTRLHPYRIQTPISIKSTNYLVFEVETHIFYIHLLLILFI